MTEPSAPASVSPDDRSRITGSREEVKDLLGPLLSMADEIAPGTLLERVLSAACQLVDASGGVLGRGGADHTVGHFIRLNVADDEVLTVTSLSRWYRVPIRIRNIDFGDLYLAEKRSGGPFTSRDRELLEALTFAAGIAIENSRLLDESKRRTQWLQGGLSAARELLEQGNDARDDLNLIARHALHASQSDLTVVLRDFGQHRGLIVEAAEGVNAGAFLGQSGADNAKLDGLTPRSGPLVLTEDDMDRLLPGAPPATVSTALITRLAGTEERQFILFGRPEGSVPFSDVDQEMVRAFTSQVALSLELLRVHRKRGQNAILDDRNRIARDLHDLVIQRLFAAGLSIQALRKNISDREPLERISTVTAELDATIRELRDTIYSLQSIPKITPTFASSVFTLIADTFDGHDLHPVVHLSGPLETAIDPAWADHVRAILLEGLSNALRHAKAQSITMTLQALPDRFELRITDNGQGFNQGVHRSGLANMEQRAELCGGTLHIQSSPGQGTDLVLTIPLTTSRKYSSPPRSSASTTT